jgi:peroxiredoxin
MRRTDRQWWVVGGFVVLLAGLLGAGWLVRDRFLPVEVGTGAPDFAARDMQGRPVSLEQLRGQVVLLNIWATWCGPCREEMPSLQRLHERLGPRGLRVVAVSVDGASATERAAGDPRRLVGDFAREMGLDFTLWLDPSGQVQRTYRTTGVPESFVIDRQGTIVKKVIGATEWDSGANVELVERLLKS